MKMLAAIALMIPSLALAESAGGITYTAPPAWAAQTARPMRVGTYIIPHAKGDAEDAELAVFYFGEGQGGTIDANVTRWAGQFDAKQPPKTKKQKQGALEVTRVEIAGTYTSAPMMGGGAPTTHAKYELLGAIVDAGKGPVFWKLTGPAATVESARTSFDKLVRGIKKQ